MPISDTSWSGKLRLIGELERPDHYHLRSEDRCYFLGDYTPRENWRFSLTNHMIFNLTFAPWHAIVAHKLRTIQQIGQVIRSNLKPEALAAITFVPVPPSKLPTHPVARAIGPDADVRELIVGVVDRDPMHATHQRRDPVALRASLRLRPELLSPWRSVIVLLDDMVTTGCSFTVCKSILAEHKPGISIIGISVARRVNPSPSDIDWDGGGGGDQLC